MSLAGRRRPPRAHRGSAGSLPRFEHAQAAARSRIITRRLTAVAGRLVSGAAALAVLSLTALPPGAATAPTGGHTARPAAAPATGTASGPVAAAAADSIRARQWPLTSLHLARAWKHTQGAGVLVAVLDTGVDGRHQDLTGQVVDGPDYTDGSRKPGSRYWGHHGTAVASIIAGHGHGPGGSSGIIGVAPEARILSIRVTWENDDPVREVRTDLNRNSDAVSRGIRYAVDSGAKVINMSLGGGRLDYYGNEIDKAAIEYALSKGVVLIASMGNDGSTANRRNFPAAYPGVIAVGAVDRDQRPWKDSNRHEYVSVAAPGVEIVSADAGNAYVIGSGTSTSAAFVAGVAALIRADYPKLSPKEVKQAIEAGVSQRPATGRDTKIGAGVVDAIGALKAAYKINKRRHNAAADAPKPAPASAGTPKAVAGPESAGTSILLIGILIGGAVLVVAGLVIGWRQRHETAEDQIGGLAAAVGAVAEPVHAMASVPGAPEPGIAGVDDARVSGPAQRPASPSARRAGARSFTADGEDTSGPHVLHSPYGRSARRAAPELGPEPSASGPRPVEPSIAEAPAVDSFGTDPLSTDPLSTDRLGTDPLSADRWDADPLNADPSSTDPLGVDPLSTDAFASPTTSPQRPRRPGAGEAARGSDALKSSTVPMARTGPSPEEVPAVARDARPAQRPEATDHPVEASPGTDSPQGGLATDPSRRREAEERPARRRHEDEEEDYRPPWW